MYNYLKYYFHYTKLIILSIPHARFLINAPSLQLPFYSYFVGNEVHLVVGTDTEYEKKDDKNHYGVKCKVIGYEWSDNAQQV